MGRSLSDHGVTLPAHVVLAEDDARVSGVLSWLLRERGYAKAENRYLVRAKKGLGKLVLRRSGLGRPKD